MILICAACSAQNRVPAARIGSRARCGQCKAHLCPPERPLSIPSEEDFNELVRDAPLPVVVDFWAAWCAPCRLVAPELEALARERAGTAIVTKVDTEALPSLAGRFGIRGIPTMILFRSGREAKRMSGATTAARIAEALSL
jgi:thioredoxin 2